MENFATDWMFPDWQIWTQYVSSDFNMALDLDGLENSHPIEVAVNHPDEVDEIFDAISYSKGSVVIRMLQNYLGAETFRKALAIYMNKFSYKNALTEDLVTHNINHACMPVCLSTCRMSIWPCLLSHKFLLCGSFMFVLFYVLLAQWEVLTQVSGT